MSLYILQQLRAACTPSYGQQAAIFASMASRAGERPKRKTAVKAIYRPATAFYTLVAIPYMPAPQNVPQRPADGQTRHK